MTIEEKAKAYDEAIERARKEYKNHESFLGFCEMLVHIFPELKESEDGRIRKWLIEYFNKINDEIDIKDREKIIAWLEKQGEQKPADKVEPKFKVGDWVIFDNGNVECITSVGTHGYTFDDGDYLLHDDCDKNAHLWTIQDAKDGDVLSYRDDQWIFIYKEKIDNNSFSYYTLYSTIHQDLTIDDGAFTLLGDTITPATKEQRSFLFQKMKEAGYVWDAERKELEKIEEEYNGEDYGIDGLWHAQSILEKTLGKVDGYQSDDGILEHKCAISAVKKLYEQKSAWSEEDEMFVHGLIRGLAAKRDIHGHTTFSSDCIDITETINWLKSLKDRYAWKPSDKQMEYLAKAITTLGDEGNCKTASILNDLRVELKKLREE